MKHLYVRISAMLLTACFTLAIAAQEQDEEEEPQEKPKAETEAKIKLPDTPFPPNPAVRMFQDNIIFYQSFEHSLTEADVSLAKGAAPDAEVDEDGLFGRGLKRGSIRFNMGSAIPTDLSGTVIMWVKLRAVPPKQKMEPPATFFSMDMVRGKTLGCKGAGSNYWGRENMLFMAFLPTKDGKLKSVSVSPYMGSTVFRDWTLGTWKLLVFTWTSETIGISVDGNRLNETQIKQPLASPEKISLNFHAGQPEGKHPLYSIDECMVLNRQVSSKELAELYAATMQEYKKLHKANNSK